MDVDELRKAIVREFKARRESQREFGTRAGIEQGQVSKLFDLSRSMPEVRARTLFDAIELGLGSSLADFFRRHTPRTGHGEAVSSSEETIDPAERELLRAYRLFAKYAQPPSAEARALDPGQAAGRRNQIPDNDLENRPTRRRRHRRRSTNKPRIDDPDNNDD